MHMKKIVLFAFQGEAMCFVHVLLNALEMKSQGIDARIVIEGEATDLVPELAREGNPLHRLYREAKEQGLIDGACRACSGKMQVAEEIEKEGLPLLDEMSGHPSMTRYMNEGFDILIF